MRELVCTSPSKSVIRTWSVQSLIRSGEGGFAKKIIVAFGAAGVRNLLIQPGSSSQSHTHTHLKMSRRTHAVNTKPQAASESVQMLLEIFPDWNQEDLSAILADVSGDVELAVNRIASGIR